MKATDFPPDSAANRTQLLDALPQEAFDGEEVAKDRRDFCRFLDSLGSHDLLLMRDVLGLPESVAGVFVNEPFYLAILNYRKERPTLCCHVRVGHRFSPPL